jgi:hypothetical protein
MATKKKAEPEQQDDELEFVINVSVKAVDAFEALEKMKDGHAKILAVNPRPVRPVPQAPTTPTPEQPETAQAAFARRQAEQQQRARARNLR